MWCFRHPGILGLGKQTTKPTQNMKTTKTTSMVTKAALALAACASLNALAGTKPAAAAPAAPASEGLMGSITATADISYDSRYYFRGLWFADNILTTTINVTVPLADKLTLGLGGSYVKDMATPYGGSFDYQERDLFGSLNYDAGFAKFGLVYTQYGFPKGFSGSLNGGFIGAGELNVNGAEELGFTVSAPVGPVNVSAGAYYDFRIGASYYQLGFDTSVEVTSAISIVPAIAAGYGVGDYYTGATSTSGFTHLIPSVSAPVKLSKNATLTPYVAYNISGDQRRGNTTNSEAFGGVKLSVSY